MSALLSTLLSGSDDERAALERELVTLARQAAVGELAGDIAHDLANPLFGVIGLVELLLEDVTAGSPEAERLRLVHQTTLELKTNVQALLDLARARDDGGHGRLVDAAKRAVEAVRHGIGRRLELEERYAGDATVAAPPNVVAHAVLQLLLAGRSSGRVTIDVEEATAGVSPVPADSLGAYVASRLVEQHGGSASREGDWLRLHWTR